jgi:hypothetical protein
MAMKLLRFRELPTQFVARVQLDDTQVLADGTPDPAWVAEYRYGKDRNPGETKAAYLTRLRGEVRALALEELARRQATANGDEGTALAGEGAVL